MIPTMHKAWRDRARRAALVVTLAVIVAGAAASVASADPPVVTIAADSCRACTPGCVLEADVFVTGSASLDALGFDVRHDGLRFVGVARGPLVGDWTAFEARALGDRVRIGGYTGDAYALDGTVKVATLRFTPTAPAGTAAVHIAAFVDDLAGTAACSTNVEWAAAAVRPPPNGFIGIYPLTGPPICCYDTPDGTQLRVVARPQGAATAGITSAEFRIEATVAGVTLDWTPAPGATFVGTPYDPDHSGGVTVTLPQCSEAAADEVLLGTLTVHGLAVAGELRVRRSCCPRRAGLPCAFFGLCDAPICDGISAGTACISAGFGDPILFRALVNQQNCGECGVIEVGVAARTWSDVKRLYRDP
jgi:hypothetical protein